MCVRWIFKCKSKTQLTVMDVNQSVYDYCLENTTYVCSQTAGSNTLLLAGSSRHLAEASNE